MCDDLLAESEIWLNQTLLVADLDRNAKLQEGRNPAQGLRSAAIDLSCSKQTVFSPNIERLVAMAAKVALLSFEPSSPSLKSYERARASGGSQTADRWICRPGSRNRHSLCDTQQ